MTSVTIRVEREGGSVIKVTERSAFPLHTDDQTVLLVQEAFIRTCRALGVRDQAPPQPDPGGASATPEPEPVAADTAAVKIDRKAA